MGHRGTGCREEALALAQARAAAYSFLSALLRREVGADALSRLAASDIAHAASGRDGVDAGGMATMGEYLRQRVPQASAGTGSGPAAEEALESCRHELAADFAHIFLMGKGCVHPYESVYTSARGLLMQDAYRAARAAYAEAGIVVSDDSDEMADHAAIELEFMAILASRLAAALAAHDEGGAVDALERQRAFFAAHLGWIPRLADDIESVAQTGFYRGLAVFLRETVESDFSFMEEISGCLASAA